jgi:hypothetical protein
MGPFMRRHDLRTRRTYMLLFGTILLVAVATLAWSAFDRGSLAALPWRLWFGMLFPLLPIGVLWLGGAVMRRRRTMQPDGSMPMNPDEARGAERVANVGAVYVAGIGVVVIAGQLFSALNFMQALPSLDGQGRALFARATVVVTGALVAYFGNAWPRIPPPRRPGQEPATVRKFNRYLGWIMVIHGLLMVLAGLILTKRDVFAAGTGTIAVSMVLFLIGCKLLRRLAARPPSAA